MGPRSATPRADSVSFPERERSRVVAALEGGGDNAIVQADAHSVALTHLDRIYWPADAELGLPAITKRDFLRYLVEVAAAMLPNLRDRPLTLFRWPEGIRGRRVLEKHWKIKLPPFVERVDVFSDSKGRTDQYILCNNLATLMWLAHMGTLEFHAWHSRVRTGADASGASVDFASSTSAVEASILERPDYILFDIDPFIYSGREVKGKEPAFNAPAFDKARASAMSLHSVLTGIGLDALVKTSGKTGLHVIVPIRRTLRYDAVREMARFIGERLMREHRGDITLDWFIEKRTGKVFLDTNMNVRGKSMTVAWSPRGLPGAPVSMPLTWRALKDASPTDFRVGTAATLLAKRGDAWAGWLDRAQSVEEALTRDIDDHADVAAGRRR